jgi:phosphoglycerate dehydrogenase-like enzyme
MTSEMQRPRVLICDAIASVGIEMLQEYAEVDIKTGLKPEELMAIVDGYEAIVVRSATKITGEIIKRGTRLKVIGRAGAGLDTIDVVTARERDIMVVNSPDSNTLAVAEHTMALLLALVRHLPQADVGLKQGRWEKKQLMGTGLAGKTLGIIGFGRIGREVAIRALAFGMTVLVNQRRPTPELNLEMGVTAVDLNDLLKKSDFVSLHVPSRPETEKLIGAEQLALMKPTAYLINTARGTVIDEEAMLAALNENRLNGAALDVFVEEPATHNALAQHPKVIATPHIAASTQDAQQAGAITVARQIIDIIRDSKSGNPLSLRVVPTESIKPHENVDLRRVERLAKRLTEDGSLANPPIVIESGGHYVVLDGATRTTAFKLLNYPHAIVQLTSLDDGLNLGTWFHAICGAEADQVITLLKSIPEVSLLESTAERVVEDMLSYNGLCYIYTTQDEVWLVTPTPDTNNLDALNKLTQTYIENFHVERTLSKDVHSLRQEHADLAAVVIFQQYSVSQVLQIAQAGRVLPAGITRFIIPGRVLRLNADLSMLKADKPLREKEAWLDQLVLDKLASNRVRYYAEPVYLLDE